MLSRGWLLGLLTACTFHHGAAGADAAGNGEGSDSAAECALWHARHFDPCAIPLPGDAIDLSGAWTFDTDQGTFVPAAGTSITPPGEMLAQSSGVSAYLISIASFKLEAGASLRVTGGPPLIVASWDRIDVLGAIDAGSTPMQAGGGANPSACMAAKVGGTAVASGGSGGGGGGAFRGNGGTGGTGDMPQGPLGGAGGVALAPPTIVLGGCSGAASGAAGPGDTGDPTAASAGGTGGGAIQLSARNAIAVSGRVLSGGAGGGGAPQGSACGGGGGGAGGFVGFDSPMIDFDGAIVAANGGGGGGSAPFNGTGMAGQDGQPSATPATGGPASSCSVAGMAGGAGAMLDGATSTNPIESCGGSGGGGGVGFVLAWGTVTMTSTPVISPALQTGP